MIRFTCSVAVRGGKGAAGRYRWHVWGGPAVFRPHWVCSCSQVCVLPIYIAQAPSCSIWSGPCMVCGSSFWVFHKSTDSVGPVFCAFPGLSSSGSQELDWRTLPRCGVPSPLHGPSLSLGAPPVGCMCLVYILWSWTLAGTLLADVDHPESQEVFG